MYLIPLALLGDFAAGAGRCTVVLLTGALQAWLRPQM